MYCAAGGRKIINGQLEYSLDEQKVLRKFQVTTFTNESKHDVTYR
jgi:hypothetical protein